MGWFENEGSYETEAAVSSVVRGTGGVLEEEKARFPSKGTLEFSKNQAKAEAENKKIFYQALKEDQARTQQAKDKMWLEEEINDITSNMSTEEKNRLLHYQASYKDRSVYQMAALRKKIIEERRKAEKQNKEASVAETKPGASALQTAFEGGSGSQGAGQANLSAHATG